MHSLQLDENSLYIDSWEDFRLNHRTCPLTKKGSIKNTEAIPHLEHVQALRIAGNLQTRMHHTRANHSSQYRTNITAQHSLDALVIAYRVTIHSDIKGREARKVSIGMPFMLRRSVVFQLPSNFPRPIVSYPRMQIPGKMQGGNGFEDSST